MHLNLIQVLYEELGIDKEEAFKFIEFLAIATVCDVVDLLMKIGYLLKRAWKK